MSNTPKNSFGARATLDVGEKSYTYYRLNKLAEDGAHHPAEWFDTPEKRLQWWLDLEPQWRKAFNEAGPRVTKALIGSISQGWSLGALG